MFKPKLSWVFFSVFIVLAFTSAAAFAVEDGFISSKEFPGKHLFVYCESGVDTALLAKQLNITPSNAILAGKSTAAAVFSDVELADKLDTLLIMVCDILDIRLYSFEGSIKVCRNNERLKKIYYDLFGRDLNNLPSFYVHDLKTIYVSAEGFKSGTIGHEVAHAVISSYFVVLPPVKLQEVLSGYVEYQLRKMENSPTLQQRR